MTNGIRSSSSVDQSVKMRKVYWSPQTNKDLESEHAKGKERYTTTSESIVLSKFKPFVSVLKSFQGLADFQKS